MIFPGRWGSFCVAFLAVLLCPGRVFGVDKLLIVNGTELTMNPEQTEPFIGYVGLQWVPFEAHFTPAVEVGWRLSRVKAADGSSTVEWRCPTCWSGATDG